MDSKLKEKALEPSGWAAERTSKIEPPAKSLSAGHGHDRWATRAEQHSFGSGLTRSPEQIAAMAKRRRIPRISNADQLRYINFLGPAPVRLAIGIRVRMK
jgi:hypothetical protein